MNTMSNKHMAQADLSADLSADLPTDLSPDLEIVDLDKTDFDPEAPAEKNDAAAQSEPLAAKDEPSSAVENDTPTRARRGLLRGWEWSLLMVAPILAVLGAYAAILLTPQEYVARAKLLVPFGREYLYRPIVGNVTLAPWKFEVAMNSEFELLNAKAIKEKAIARVGAHVVLGLSEEQVGAAPEDDIKEKIKTVLRDFSLLLPPRSLPTRAYEEYQKNIMITGVKNSNVIDISIKWKEPEIAGRLLSAHLASYFESRAEVYSPQKVSVLEDVLQRREATLDAAQNDFERFLDENGVTEIELQMQNAFGQEQRLQEQLLQTEIALSEAQAAQVAGTLKFGLSAEGLSQLENRIGSLQDTDRKLKADLTALNKRIAALTRDRTRLDVLKDRIDVARAQVRDIRMKMGEVAIEQTVSEAQVSNVRLVEGPFVSERPVGLPPITKLAVAGFLGLMAAIGLIIGLRLLRRVEMLAPFASKAE